MSTEIELSSKENNRTTVLLGVDGKEISSNSSYLRCMTRARRQFFSKGESSFQVREKHKNVKTDVGLTMMAS